MSISYTTKLFFGFIVTKEQILKTFPGKFTENNDKTSTEFEDDLFEEFLEDKKLKLSHSGDYWTGKNMVYLVSASKIFTIGDGDHDTIPEIKVERKTRQRLKALAKKFGVSYGICVANSVS